MAKYVCIFPRFIDDIGIPALGDRVISDGDMWIRTPDTKRNVRLASIPKNARSGDSMRVTLSANTQKLWEIANQYAFVATPPVKSDGLRLEVKALIENYRSILDYLAHDITAICLPVGKGRKIYFPIAGPNQTQVEFEDRLKREFVGLDTLAPKLFQYLVEIQRFGYSPWLEQLGAAVNSMKHNHLVDWEQVTCKSIIIHHKGVGIRIGDLGVLQIELLKNGSFTLIAPDDVPQKLRGPQSIDVNTTRLNDADPSIELDTQEWASFGLAGTSRSLVTFLGDIDASVRYVCTRVTSLLPPRMNPT